MLYQGIMLSEMDQYFDKAKTIGYYECIRRSHSKSHIAVPGLMRLHSFTSVNRTQGTMLSGMDRYFNKAKTIGYYEMSKLVVTHQPAFLKHISDLV